MFDLDKVQTENAEWVTRNFNGKNDDTTSFMGMVEELGELAHVRLKRQQGIRAIQAYAEEDAIGDLAIYMLHYCTTRGWKLSQIIDYVWNQVKQRDWVAFPRNGVDE